MVDLIVMDLIKRIINRNYTQVNKLIPFMAVFSFEIVVKSIEFMILLNTA